VTVTGTRKAALLLMNLDPTTAGELLQSAEPNVIREIASELAYLQAVGQTPETAAESAKEFFGFLKNKTGGGSAFLKQMLRHVLGEQQGKEILEEVQSAVQARDPFLRARQARPENLAKALEGESPQVVGLVLAELPTKQSGELLSLLDEDVGSKAVRAMAGGEEIPNETKIKVAKTIERRLESLRGASPKSNKQEQLRKIADLLRGLPLQSREVLLQSITEYDKDTADTIQKLMITWKHLVLVPDRMLQKALHDVKPAQLALALDGADEALVERVRSNISERVAARLDEEASLISSPTKKDVENAREAVLGVLRELNAKGELELMEEE